MKNSTDLDRGSLLLSRFSHVRLCETPQMAAYQAHLSLGFSRQKYWMGCHFLLQCMKVKSESEVVQSCLTHSDPMDSSLPGSSIHGIFQAGVLEWGAITFSDTVLPQWWFYGTGIKSTVSSSSESFLSQAPLQKFLSGAPTRVLLPGVLGTNRGRTHSLQKQRKVFFLD